MTLSTPNLALHLTGATLYVSRDDRRHADPLLRIVTAPLPIGHPARSAAAGRVDPGRRVQQSGVASFLKEPPRTREEMGRRSGTSETSDAVTHEVYSAVRRGQAKPQAPGSPRELSTGCNGARSGVWLASLANLKWFAAPVAGRAVPGR